MPCGPIGNVIKNVGGGSSIENAIVVQYLSVGPHMLLRRPLDDLLKHSGRACGGIVQKNTDITACEPQGSGAAAAAAPAAPLAAVEVALEDAPERPVYVAPVFDPTVPAPKKGGAGYLAGKRVFDVVFSACVCVVAAIPVAAACAAIAIESPGNPFFRQERVGQNGKPIRIFKLRSMVADAHENPQKYMTDEQFAVWKREQKLDDDPRITKVGRILRRTSLDELPQFINVLTGDLSVIGPRPVTLEETYEFGTARDEVLACKPGITGWWAVTDRNNSTWESGERQERELFYVRHQSFGLDARVFVKTFKAMARGK